MEAKPIAFLCARTARVKCTWKVTRYEMTAFFRRLLHQVECTRVSCASPWLTTPWKVVSSTRHPEWSIITVRSRLPIKRLRERRNDLTRARVQKREGVQTERLKTETIVETKQNINFLLSPTVIYILGHSSKSTMIYGIATNILELLWKITNH